MSPTEVVMPSGRVHYPDPAGPINLPPPDPLPWLTNTTLDSMTGLIYEADITRECIQKGSCLFNN